MMNLPEWGWNRYRNDDQTRAVELVDQWMHKDRPTSSLVSQPRDYARTREAQAA